MSPRRASSEVRAIRMKCAAPSAPVMNHLRPWMTHLPSFRSARVRIMPGSEPPPGAGSVMAKDERTLPSTIGRSQRSFWAGVPARGEQVHVAVVGRHAVEGERAEHRARGLLVHRRPGDDRQRHAAELLGRLRRPQPRGLRLGAHRLEALFGDVLVLGEIRRIASPAAARAPRRRRGCAGAGLRSRAAA